MFELGAQNQSSDNKPILLLSSILEAEFEVFISIAYGSRYFLSQPTRSLALSIIKTRSSTFPASKLIHISYDYQTQLLFLTAFHRLVVTPLWELTNEDIDNIGIAAYVALSTAKEAIQEHRAIVTAEECPIETHAPVLGIGTLSGGMGWGGSFWMGARNPLTWTDPMERFEKLDFGEMGAGCRVKVLNRVRGGDAYSHSYSLVNRVAYELMKGIDEEQAPLSTMNL
ncbi:hypothetical protein C8J57DRAFT_1248899 [Mycena rebaudengoi]|nr:hypothetical protein C8J57DRAFT_1248899 [Mycena rebaudengoi]